MLTTSLLRIMLTRSFRPFVFENQARPLAYQGLPQLGLYVHIPFCRTLCNFCPYCRVPYEPEAAADYRQALLAEIDLVGQSMATHRQVVTSLYFGGGTPATMIDHLGEIVERLRLYFEINGGIGCELHPDDLIPENITKLLEAGITMVSVGIQSFDPGCLEQLGRQNDSFAEKIAMLRDSRLEVIDVDLIFGLPGQTETSLKQDVLTAFASGATQVSTYPFIDFSYADNRYGAASNHRQKELMALLDRVGQENGLRRTAVWTFARPDTKRYSSVTRDHFLGFGLSATTLLHDQFKINTFSLEAYIDRLSGGFLPTSLTLTFKPRQRAAYDLFWAAYGLTVENSRFAVNIGQSIEAVFGFEVRLAILLGLVRRVPSCRDEANPHNTNSDYGLTARGIWLYHRLEQHYTHAYIDRMWQVSREQAFPEKIILR